MKAKADYEKFLQLTPEEFDQNEELGWRKLDKEGHPLEAAEFIGKYLDSNHVLLHNGSADNLKS